MGFVKICEENTRRILMDFVIKSPKNGTENLLSVRNYFVFKNTIVDVLNIFWLVLQRQQSLVYFTFE